MNEIIYSALNLNNGFAEVRCRICPISQDAVSISAHGDLLFFVDVANCPTLLDWRSGKQIVGHKLDIEFKYEKSKIALSDHCSYCVICINNYAEAHDGSRYFNSYYLAFDRNLKLIHRSKDYYVELLPVIVLENGTVLFKNGILVDLTGHILTDPDTLSYYIDYSASLNGQYLIETKTHHDSRTHDINVIATNSLKSGLTFKRSNQIRVYGTNSLALIDNTGTKVAIRMFNNKKGITGLYFYVKQRFFCISRMRFFKGFNLDDFSSYGPLSFGTNGRIIIQQYSCGIPDDQSHFISYGGNQQQLKHVDKKDDGFYNIYIFNEFGERLLLGASRHYFSIVEYNSENLLLLTPAMAFSTNE
ncbi:MAG: hypothetical protein NTV01_16325 [Bacteroidia bacterium]|nr:hypothetical protein [Bacteroidia bacterium]